MCMRNGRASCVFILADNSEVKSSSDGRDMQTTAVSTADQTRFDSSVTTQTDTVTRYVHRTVESL